MSNHSTRSPTVELDGLGVAQGIAIGPAYVTESGSLDVPSYKIATAAIDDEVERFNACVEKSKTQIAKLAGKTKGLPESAAEELGYLLAAHGQMLEGSRLVRGVENRIREQRVNAESAVSQEVGEIANAFAQMEDSYLAERSKDVRDVGQRLLRNLMESPYRALTDLPNGTVVVADELTPADTALLDPQNVAGFVTAVGGAQDHTGILARSLGMPAVVGTPDLLHHVRTGDMVIVDGRTGRVTINPDDKTLARYKGLRTELGRQARKLEHLRNVPANTRDEVRIGLQANIDLANEVEPALAHGAEGIGLFRTEYLFLNRDDIPTEDEQYVHLRNIVDGMKGRTVTVRTLDVGNDKLPYSLGEHLTVSANPAMGLRAIRLSLKVKELLENQLCAILRAGAHGPVRILLPMISTSSEVRQVRQVLKKMATRLRRRKVKIADPMPPVGAMIEIPGAALSADGLARDCEFFSIGTNDLTMYTLAIDRGDEQVAHLYSPLHPAVLRLIQFTTAAALRARIPVNVCGEMAGDERMTAILLGLGIRDLSMASSAVPRVKQRIRNLDINEATRRAQTIMEQTDAGMVAALLDDFNALA
ncbi:MAG: phosphoenolpyruvate--protein phosphotransferase [Alphaproteobacteria bacterium]|jgi:phosphoenolpyruvate-protein phosphotransferase (PTS system enzyme I)|nr:phosphoenolpyruvate--protein phosphotransferase [Rhodospirillaceae bacterium]MDG2482529.1 phosphoenolpyruvate--protein phosphotransferase [Alphaproteobacteria bacterium]MBT6206052.1 phosphoenolpyruvate--protein phosphotransferase [Rhodospirillaceae bacterium]MBT6511548.1 phosphoenolpyruvate--protein phosphotransferase [Rhodospirillaceae bacterium]MBT7614208.1 phosphoenolpyruvate--protein phosphotransferase [Rhodospirillaceae bacterium]